MFLNDLVSFLRQWKVMGDFNKDMYTMRVAHALSGDDLRFVEKCWMTTGVCLPSTHSRGQVPIDAVFGTACLQCTAVALLPGSEVILGVFFFHAIPIACRLLNCTSDKIKPNYIKVLN
jgi:hypothetical protein